MNYIHLHLSKMLSTSWQILPTTRFLWNTNYSSLKLKWFCAIPSPIPVQKRKRVPKIFSNEKKIPFSALQPILDNSLQATVTFLMLPDIFLNKVCKSNLNLVSVQPRVKYWSLLSDGNLKVLGTTTAWWKYSCFVPFSTTHWEITLPGGPDSLHWSL